MKQITFGIFAAMLSIVALCSCVKPQDNVGGNEGDGNGGGDNGGGTEVPVVPSEPDKPAPVPTNLAFPYIISDGMVLQQNSSVNISGTHDPHVKVELSTSWSDATYEAVTDESGHWNVVIETPAASSDPQKLTVKDALGGIKEITDVLIGEVWLCAGQSNMEHPMMGFGFGTEKAEPVASYSTLIADSEYPELRYFRVPKNISRVPLYNTLEAVWQKATRSDTPRWSAIGFLFGRELHKKLGVPVGIICNAYGGTRIEGWMPQSLVETLPANSYKGADKLSAGENSPSAPSNTYNAMMHPVIQYGYRGMLWLQGEANADGLAWAYAGHFRDLVKSWRKIAGREFPIYYVQLAPWNSSWEDAPTVRFCQFRGWEALIPNCGIVGAADAGSSSTIHFANKKPVADRLLLWAMSREYGDSSVNPMGPHYASHTVSSDKLTVYLNNAEGLYFKEGTANPPYAEISGADGVWYEARVELNSDGSLVFSSPSVPSPKNARYCYSNWHVGTIYNSQGLPLFPFATDKIKK